MLHLADLVVQAKAKIEQSQDIETLELIRVEYLGKKGYVTQQIKALRDLSPDMRPTAGMVINQAKQDVRQALAHRKATLKSAEIEALLATETLDVSLPGRRMENGSLHPISHTIARVEHFFGALGFSVVTGPEIEDDYHNFDALNIPPHHPARADHDTFWFDTTRLLRTQTSGVQIRTMKAQQPPIRIIAPGRVYRNDYNQTHTPMFHQMEGLIIDINISFTNLKGTLYDFLRNFFEENLQIRFRPSYFPFTEPSAEVDIEVDMIRKNSHWLEVLGCGMVHPNVLRHVGIDPEIYSGFAFGIGLERLTMLRYGITDLRAFFANDLRFLKQFK
ncbi:phenylalanine--tRNA ligase subunit alpha [Candidatus Doolittlea endobia]|uniref:Phenylalanine--tRNA ligase alpha subunit n=1 Tax=Candidatus Doolittlea endobia TaxID=1778262 RepID=A0A143WRS5_9ENTR|nr:phenylalanine--tRNA ligase subunit alpha [Candidatus Doolittlea endobia]CUX96410.1 Phenylalanine--tRNA ligase alpha subunit [Candidatus Doolittlea endobia]